MLTILFLRLPSCLDRPLQSLPKGLLQCKLDFGLVNPLLSVLTVRSVSLIVVPPCVSRLCRPRRPSSPFKSHRPRKTETSDPLKGRKIGFLLPFRDFFKFVQQTSLTAIRPTFTVGEEKFLTGPYLGPQTVSMFYGKPKHLGVLLYKGRRRTSMETPCRVSPRPGLTSVPVECPVGVSIVSTLGDRRNRNSRGETLRRSHSGNDKALTPISSVLCGDSKEPESISIPHVASKYCHLI